MAVVPAALVAGGLSGSSLALLGGGALSALGSIGGGLIGKSSAKSAAGSTRLATMLAFLQQQQAQKELRQARGTALGLLQPFTSAGTGALGSLQRLLISPDELQRQRQFSRAELERELADAQSSKAGIFDAGARQTRIQQAQSRLTQFDQQTEALQGGGDPLTASPLFEFESRLANRNLTRTLAARPISENARAEAAAFQNEALVASEGERQLGRLFDLTRLGLSSAGTGAQVLTGTAANVGSLADAGARLGLTGTTAANQFSLQGTDALIHGIAGASNAATQTIGAVLNQQSAEGARARLDAQAQPTVRQSFPSFPNLSTFGG